MQVFFCSPQSVWDLRKSYANLVEEQINKTQIIASDDIKAQASFYVLEDVRTVMTIKNCAASDI